MPAATAATVHTARCRLAPRNQAYLDELFGAIWEDHFSDVPRRQVRVEFGRRARTRLGSISLDPRDRRCSLIRVNGLFREPFIPEFIIKATLVHEISHYAHGFNSPLARKFKHPHSGGVMRAEFRERGLEALYLQQKEWLRENWPAIVKEHFAHARRRPYWFI